MMWLILLLIVVGLFLLVTEVVLLPGITVAGVGAFLSCGGAIWLAFDRYGTSAGIATVVAVAVLALVALAVSLKTKTWQRFSLKQKIDGVSQPDVSRLVKEVACGVTLTRLAPMGKVVIDGQSYEAKSIDSYIDPKTEVTVIGFENFSLIVKPNKK